MGVTQSTDQNRADFEAIMRNSQRYKPEMLNRVGDSYELDTMESAWQGFQLGMQAYRRAQVVSQGWKLVPDEVPDEMVDAAIEAYMPFGDMRFAIFAALAAAPQPPEAAQLDDINVADMAQTVDSKESEPVQMPEPQAEIEVRSMKTYLDLSIHEWRDTLPDGTYKIYTEHQVRQLLAQHGIK